MPAWFGWRARGVATAAAGLLIAVVPAFVPLPASAGHDQVEDDLVYFLPIAAERAKRLVDAGETVWFVDLRSVEEFRRERVPGAHSIPLHELSKRYQRIPTDGRVVLYCACAEGKIEEGYAYQVLRGFGYRNVSVLEGGFAEWRRLGYPVEGGGS